MSSHPQLSIEEVRAATTEPVATHGPFLEADLRIEQEEVPPTESTKLLPGKSHNSCDRPAASPLPETGKDVHYRNIASGHRFWWLFITILFGAFIAYFDSTLMASSHPVITSYFHASNSASWLSTVFYLTSTVVQPLYGRISDTIGRRPVFLFTTLVFFASTAWCALADSIGSFIAARAVCGLGAGGVISVGFIMTSDVVKIEYRGIYQSYYNLASYGLGNGMGAAFGGLLCDSLGWRAAFGVQLPFIFAFATLAFLTVPSNLGPQLAKSQGKTILESLKTFDALGAITLTTTTTTLILGINLGGNVLTWTHPVVITSLLLSILSFLVLIPIERRATRPILPLHLLTTKPLSNLNHSNFFCSMATNGILFNVPLYLQAVRQTSPTTSGLYLISPLLGVAVSAVFSGFYITWTRRMKPMVSLGSLFVLLGSVLVTLAPSIPSDKLPIWALLLLIPGASIGQGFFFPATTIAVLALSTDADQAVVTTTLGLLRSLGAILGVAVSSWILQNGLVYYLEKLVTVAKGPEEKERVIREVRGSVAAIRKLDPVTRGQVQEAYSRALTVTFAVGIAVAVVVVLLMWPVGLPRLQQRREERKGKDVDEGEVGDDFDGGGGDMIEEEEEEEEEEAEEEAESEAEDAHAGAAVDGLERR